MKQQRRHGRRQEDRARSSSDTTGPAPDVAKRLAQELVTRDKVQFLAGFGLTPNAMAVAPVATEAKVPMVIMNAATVVDHDAVAVHRARLDDAAAGHRADGRVGGQERHQAGLHAGGRLRPRASTPRRSSRSVQGGRRRGRRLGARAAAEPRLRAVHPARQGRQAGGGVRVPAGRRAGHRVHEGVSTSAGSTRRASS